VVGQTLSFLATWQLKYQFILYLLFISMVSCSFVRISYRTVSHVSSIILVPLCSPSSIKDVLAKSDNFLDPLLSNIVSLEELPPPRSDVQIVSRVNVRNAKKGNVDGRGGGCRTLIWTPKCKNNCLCGRPVYGRPPDPSSSTFVHTPPLPPFVRTSLMDGPKLIFCM